MRGSEKNAVSVVDGLFIIVTMFDETGVVDSPLVDIFSPEPEVVSASVLGM